MKHGRRTMLLAMLFAAHTAAADNPLSASGAVVFINIPFGSTETTGHASSIGFDFDMPKSRPLREASNDVSVRRQPVLPLEIEWTNHGPYRVKVGGFYLDSLQ